MDLKQRLISNTLFSMIFLGFSRVIGFVLTPYILIKLDEEQFAIWAIVGAIMGFVSKSDLGVATSYAKFIAQFHAKKDYASMNHVINTGFVYYVGISLLLYTLASVGDDTFFRWYLRGKSPETVQTVIMFFRYFLLINMLAWSFDMFGAVLWGIQRSDIFQQIQMVVFVVNAGCVFLFLENGYKLQGLVWADFITTTLQILLSMIVAHKLVPELRFNPLLSRLTMFRKMFAYGIRLQFSRLAKIGQIQLSKMFLPYFLPLSAIAVYEIGNRIALSVRSVPLTLSPSIIPAASQLHALENRDALHRLYDRASKYMTLAVMYVSGFAVCMMPAIILSWTGRQIDVQGVTLVARILLIGYSYFLLSDIASVVVLGMGHPEYLARASALKLVLLTVLNVVLIPRIGLVAAALATTLSECLGTLYFSLACHQELHRSYRSVIRTIYGFPLAACGVAAGLTFGLYRSLLWLGMTPEGRLQNIVVVLVAGLIFSAVYGGILLQSSYIDSYDRELFLNYARKMLPKGNNPVVEDKQER